MTNPKAIASVVLVALTGFASLAVSPVGAAIFLIGCGAVLSAVLSRHESRYPRPKGNLALVLICLPVIFVGGCLSGLFHPLIELEHGVVTVDGPVQVVSEHDATLAVRRNGEPDEIEIHWGLVVDPALDELRVGDRIDVWTVPSGIVARIKRSEQLIVPMTGYYRDDRRTLAFALLGVGLMILGALGVALAQFLGTRGSRERRDAPPA